MRTEKIEAGSPSQWLKMRSYFEKVRVSSPPIPGRAFSLPTLAPPAARGINISGVSGIIKVEAEMNRPRPEDGHDQGV